MLSSRNVASFSCPEYPVISKNKEATSATDERAQMPYTSHPEMQHVMFQRGCSLCMSDMKIPPHKEYHGIQQRITESCGRIREWGVFDSYLFSYLLFHTPLDHVFVYLIHINFSINNLLKIALNLLVKNVANFFLILKEQRR